MPDNLLTWIHLSDLHIQTEDSFGRARIIKSLWADIRSFLKKGFQPDFVAFTGDVAYHGRDEEYELAFKEFFEPLISICEIPSDRLFVVPGNHDSNWDKTNMIQNPVPNLQTEDSIRQLLQNQDKRHLLLSPFLSYHTFTQFKLGYPRKEIESSLCYSYGFDKHHLRISVCGFNSAWLSGFNRDIQGVVSDYGKLAIAEWQHNQVFENDAFISFALAHHPFDWTMEQNRTTIEDLFPSKYSFVLTGHLHRPNVIRFSNLTGELAVIPCGAIFDNRKSPNSYNISQLDLDTGITTIYLRKYNSQHDR